MGSTQSRFIFLLLYNYGKEAENNEVILSGEQTQESLTHLQNAIHPAGSKRRAGRSVDGNAAVSGAGFQAPTCSGWGLRVTRLGWAPDPCSARKRTRGNFINCLPRSTGFHSDRPGRNGTPCLAWKFTEAEQACTCFYLHPKWLVL